MKVTYHATKRFLERVLHKVKYSREEFRAARRELEMLFGSVLPGSFRRSFPMPVYKGYVVVHEGDTVITILDKKKMKIQRGRRR